ncbi:hypothetical protein E2C01_031270 [Portunus trituberculatus]|uniref:Uncharacterized protein n=1 Tax=Portunus trituberculatus TaxID=210409 RepID=A0A5B7EXN9_PORTR|nr:hypothetical protein [Portunus trituberculatus]
MSSSLNAFPFSTVLFGKLYFPISFTHCLILIFFTCLLAPLASVTSTRYSLSIFFFFSFSIPFTILYKCYEVGSPISFSLSSYVRSFSSGTFFVAIFWIRSNLLVSFLGLGVHTTAAYSSLGHLMLIIFFFIMN